MPGSPRAELRLNRRPTTPNRNDILILSRDVTERDGEEGIWVDWRSTVHQQAQAEAPYGAFGGYTLLTVTHSLFLQVGSLTRSVLWTARRGPPTGETI